VRTLGTTPGAVITCTSDLAKRADGFDNVIRIYYKGTNVKLGVPEHAGGAVFDSWDLIGREVDEPGVKEVQISPKALRDYLNTQPPDSPMRAELAALLKESAPAGKGRGASAASPERDLAIRVEPTVRSAVIGIAPALEEAEVLEDGKRWKRVNYRGVVGWVDAHGR